MQVAARWSYLESNEIDLLAGCSSQRKKNMLKDTKRKLPGDEVEELLTELCGSSAWHPVFIGQHAAGTCCRGCLEKWHGIPKGRPLSEDEQNHVVDVLMQLISRQKDSAYIRI